MTSQPSIANSGIAAQAFVYMEVSPISSFDDDSAQAQSARTAYPQALRMMLEMADWSFASVQRLLPVMDPPANIPVNPDMPFFYQTPGDLVVIRDVGERHTRWERQRDFLRADMPAQLPIRYTAQISDETRLPAQFTNAVALQMAVLLAGTYVPTQSKRQFLMQSLEQVAMLAMQSDARNASPRAWNNHSSPSGDWVTAALI